MAGRASGFGASSKRAGVLATLRAGLFALAALAGAAIAADPQTLVIGNGTEPESLDPQKATGVSAGNVLRDLYEGLTGVSPSGDIIPAAASSWQWQDDGRALRLTLRDGLRWSNGDPLTASDYAAGLRRLLDPATASGYAKLFAAIEHGSEVIAGRLPPSALGLHADDVGTLSIRLDRPMPNLLSLLAHPAASPIHPADLARPPKPDARIGNGAYRLTEWVLQLRIALARNPAYWNDRQTAIDRLIYLPTEDLNSELKRYRAGELDVTTSIPATQADWIRRTLGGELHVATYLGSYFYGLNLTRPPFAGNKPLRQALSLAIDRPVIATKVLHDLAAPAWSYIPPGIRDYSPQLPEWAQWPRAQREAAARRLYAAAGYSADKPVQIEIRYNTSDDHKRIAVVIAAMWKQVLGAEVRLVNEEWKVFLQHRRERRDTQAFRNTWIADSDDAQGFAEILDSRHPRNDSGYADAGYDALLLEAAQARDPALRRAKLEAAERKMLDDAPILPIYFYASKHLVKPRVEGWQDNILDWHYSKDLRLSGR